MIQRPLRSAVLAFTAFLLSSLTGCSIVGNPASASVERIRPGQLVTAHPQATGSLPSAGENIAMSYVTQSATGDNTIAFARVTIPPGKPPAGGFPVIAWAHGTTGFAPQCAPSFAGAFIDPYLDEWLKRGFAVVRTDYSGWGAFGPRPVLDGKSNAAAVIDAVVAAHAATNKLAGDWIVVGHSEGGGAALWVAGSPKASERYKLNAAIAFAPTGPGVLRFIQSALDKGAVTQGAQPFIPVTVLGAQAADPTIELDGLVADQLMAQTQAAKTSCLADLFRFPALAPGQHLKPGADAAKLVKFLAAQDPSSLKMRVPVRIYQGEKDQTTVTPETTEQMVRDLCAKGGAVSYRRYAGRDHRGVIEAGKADAFEFANTALAAGGAKSDCPA